MFLLNNVFKKHNPGCAFCSQSESILSAHSHSCSMRHTCLLNTLILLQEVGLESFHLYWEGGYIFLKVFNNVIFTFGYNIATAEGVGINLK